MTHKYFNIVSLGCPKNRVDTERILSVMIRAGYVFSESIHGADVLIINTCSFIEAAVEESISVTLDYAEENPDAFLVVAGCLPMRYKEDLQESLPEVNLFIRPEHIPELPSLIAKNTDVSRDTNSSRRRVITTPGYAFLRISEGCNRGCNYCTIPSIRGKLRSENISDLITEASDLVKQGAQELVLVGQDLTAYGQDHGHKDALMELLEELETVSGLKWIRLMYLHPSGIPKRLPEYIRQSEKVLPYLDIPFQHICAEVLKSMGRPAKKDGIRILVSNLLSQIPDLVLRTTFMVGYPTETESAYDELRDFVEEFRIQRIGIFTYSPEEGTRAFSLGDPIPEETKQARAKELSDIQLEHAKAYSERRIEAVEEAIVEGVSEETDLLLQGRLWHQAPEVDGRLFITEGKAIPGSIRRVKITSTHDYDFFGELVP